MQRGELFSFSRTGPFSLEDANETVGILRRVTLKHSERVAGLIAQLEAIGPKDPELTKPVEAEISRVIEEWNAKVRRLGGVPKGLWLVDIDSGDGYYCWKFPEQEVRYWHDYKSGYSGRKTLSEADRERNSASKSDRAETPCGR